MKKYITYLLIAGALFASCADKLNLAPDNRITDEQMKELMASDTSKIDLIIGGMVNSVQTMLGATINGNEAANSTTNSFLGLQIAHHGLVGNDMVTTATSTNTLNGSIQYGLGGYIAGRRDPASNGASVNCWRFAWNGIVAANKLLNYADDEVIEKSKSPKMMNYQAAGLIMRAYLYNFLMENFQDAWAQGGSAKLGMPLYERWSPGVYHARATAAATYDFIKADVDKAITRLTQSGKGITPAPNDFDLGVAYYIKARVSLCTGDNAAAITACDAILNSPQYSGRWIKERRYGAVANQSSDPSNPVFPPDSNAFMCIDVNPEVIFGYRNGSSGVFTSVSNGTNVWLNVFGLSIAGSAQMLIDTRLYRQIDDRDFRKAAFTETGFDSYEWYNGTNSTFGNIVPYTTLKFGATTGLNGYSTKENKATVGQSDLIYMRVSEVLLMKAEAQALSGDESGAKTTLNILLAARTKRGESPLTCNTYTPMTGLSALDMVKLQTRIEMWGEMGLEYYNNRRWGVNINRGINAPTNHLVIGEVVTGAELTLQIPKDELDYNPLCVQN